MSGYYLLDHPNRHGRHYYPTRNNKLVGIVVHITAGLEDLDTRNDDSAEATARYAATTDRKVSWHSGSDADSFLHLLPPDFTAWHCQGYNSSTYGHEISKRDTDWSGAPDEWVDKTISMAAACLAPVASKAGIPFRQVSRAQLDKAINAGDPRMGGFIGHASLDPTRRTDPGADFPWKQFLAALNGDDMPLSDKDVDRIAAAVWNYTIRKKATEGPTKAGALLAWAWAHSKAARQKVGR